MNTDAEQELTMVVRYFMGFGTKAGRNGLTLQASNEIKDILSTKNMVALLACKQRAALTAYCRAVCIRSARGKREHSKQQVDPRFLALDISFAGPRSRFPRFQASRRLHGHREEGEGCLRQGRVSARRAPVCRPDPAFGPCGPQNSAAPTPFARSVCDYILVRQARFTRCR